MKLPILQSMAILAACAAVSPLSAALLVETFPGLNFLGVSPDGNYAVGQTETIGVPREAFIWDAVNGVRRPVGGNSRAVDVTNGGIVAGYSIGGPLVNPTPTSWLWSAAAGLTPITGEGHYIWAISADGLSAVGTGTDGAFSQGFRYTTTGGITYLGDLPGGDFNSDARAISADGSVVVGGGYTGTAREAWRWTQAEGLVSLGTLAPGNHTGSWGISPDGNMIVGRTDFPGSIEQAFVWTQESGMIGIGMLPGDTVSEARDVSANGLVIGRSGNGNSFIWSASGGMRSLGFGINAQAISDDGTVIVGIDRFGTGFIARDPSAQWSSPITFSAVPEPEEYAGTAAVGILGFALWRRLRR